MKGLWRQLKSWLTGGKTKKRTEPPPNSSSKKEYSERPSSRVLTITELDYKFYQRLYFHLVRIYPNSIRIDLSCYNMENMYIPPLVYGVEPDEDLDENTRYNLWYYRFFFCANISRLSSTDRYYPNRLRPYNQGREEKGILEIYPSLTALPVNRQGVPYHFLNDYLPARYNEEHLTDIDTALLRQWRRNRSDIWHFKYNPDKPDPLRHARSLVRFAEQDAECLKTYFTEDELSKMILVCLPASSERTYRLRFSEFANYLAMLTGMVDGTVHVHIHGTRTAKHLGGTDDVYVSIDEITFFRQHVVLLDDVLTTGATMEEYTRKFNEAGAVVAFCLFLGRTLTNEDILRCRNQNSASESPAPPYDGQKDLPDCSLCPEGDGMPSDSPSP